MKAVSLFVFQTMLFTCLSLSAQVQNPVLPAPADAASARMLLEQARVLFDSGQYAAVDAHAGRAYAYFKGSNEWIVDGAQAAFWLGKSAFMQLKYGQAQVFFLESLQAQTAVRPEGSLEEARIRVELGATLMRLDDARASMNEGQKAIDLLDRLKIENCPERFRALRVIARSFYSNGLYNKAIPYYEQSLNLARDYYGEDNAEMAMVMIYFANCLNYCGFLERAQAVSERALAIQRKTPSLPLEEVAGAYMALGACQQSLKKYDEALAYYQKAIEIRQKLQSPRLAYGYSKIGQIYLENHDYKQALDYFQKGNEVLLEFKLEQEAPYAYNCRDFGLAFYGLKDYDRSVQWLNQALHIFQGPDSTSSMGIDQCYLILQIGRALTAKGDYEAGIRSFDECKKMSAWLYGPDNLLFYELYAEIAHANVQLYSKTGEEKYLEKGREHYRLMENGVEQQLQNESYQGTEKKLLFEALPYFERAIRTELLYLKSHPDNLAALEKSWELSEAMHAQLLLSAVRESNARHFAGIPDFELLRDSTLQTEIAQLEKVRENLAVQGRQFNDSLVWSVNAQIYTSKEKLRALHATFEKKYPEYFRLKYDLQPSSIAKTQQLLGPEQTLLEYFSGDSSIFLFVVQQNGSHVLELPRDFPLNEWVQDFRTGISGYYTAGNKTSPLYQKTVLQYADAAQKLYQKLLAPVAQLLSKEVLVVPGDGLGNLPFEALLSATPKDLGNFKTYPFLLHQHHFYYAYSATMLHQMMDHRHPQPPTQALLAFAPFFAEDTASLALRLRQEDAVRLGFSSLPFSGEEVLRAKKRCGEPSEIFTGQEATKQKFQELAARYRILHLATHGKANPRAGEFSFLAFNSTEAETGLLTAGDLYNLSLNADLVLLSACETGIGEQQRGEGIVSLARAFAFAGAKSIVASLWSVNDQSTMQVMDLFYAALMAGKSKNLALSEAKVLYLENNPALKAHPFFWAGFVGLGDMSPFKN